MEKIRWRKMLLASALGVIVGVACGLFMERLDVAFATMVAVLVGWACFNHLESLE